MYFGIQKIVLDIFGGQRGLTNCLIVLDILEGNGGVQRSATKKQPQKAAENSSTNNRKSSKNNRKHKQQENQHKQQEPHKQKQVSQTIKSTKQQQHGK